MNLSEHDVVIPREKLTAYLLVPRDSDDKSKFLAQAGFTQENPDDLEAALRQLITESDAIADRTDAYGTFYRVIGALHGPLKSLSVVTVWLHVTADDIYRFITLKPEK